MSAAAAAWPARRLLVTIEAMAASAPRPSALPTWTLVLSRPAATPLSRGATSRMPVTVQPTKVSPVPVPPASMAGSITAK